MDYLSGLKLEELRVNIPLQHSDEFMKTYDIKAEKIKETKIMNKK